MKKTIIFLMLSVFLATGMQSCKKQVENPVGQPLFNWQLDSLRGPFSDHKWLSAKDIDALTDDGMRITAYYVAVADPQHGGTMWAKKYIGELYQGNKKYFPGKPDLTFPVEFLTDSTFKLGDDYNGYNLAKFNAAGEKFKIVAWYPYAGVEYMFTKRSD